MRSLACLVLLGLTASAASADPCEPTFEVKKERRGEQDVWVANIKVCVDVPRPGVAFVPVSKSINYEWEELQQVFLPRTIHSVEKAPF